MKVLNQKRVQLKDGKIVDSKEIEGKQGKKVMDSIAEELVMQGKSFVKEAKSKKGIQFVTVWQEDVDASKKIALSNKPKKEAK